MENTFTRSEVFDNTSWFKLELKHLAPYLPYGLLIMVDGVICDLEGIDLVFPDTVIAERVSYKFDEIKLMLRPLSEITEVIEEILPLHVNYNLNSRYEDWYWITTSGYDALKKLPYEKVRLLFEKHFDVFGLIEKNLAIDLNSME